MMRTQSPVKLAIPFLITFIVLILSFLGSLTFGVADTSLTDLYQTFTTFDGSTEHLIIRTVRLPRAITAVLVGSALGVAGSLMQGITRNPLADPSILGINSGAAFAVVVSTLVLQNASLTTYALFALLGATISAIAVYFFASLGKKGLSPLNLTLAGSALTVFSASLTSGILIINQRTLDEIRFWLAGSIAGRELILIKQILPYFIIGLILALILGRQVTILSLGEETAQGLGQNTFLVKIMAMTAVILLAGASVAIAGPIAFMGLIMPHVVRLLVGNDYRLILPYAMMGGGILLLNADIVARIIIQPQEVPVGLILPILGAPFFIYLVRRKSLKNL